MTLRSEGNDEWARKRFFVSVSARDRLSFSLLLQYGFDLFEETARLHEDKRPGIDGLLTLKEIGRLVEDGYRVLVTDESSKKARARTEISNFDEWVKTRKKKG